MNPKNHSSTVTSPLTKIALILTGQAGFKIHGLTHTWMILPI